MLQSLWAQAPQKKTYLKADEIIYNPKGSKPGRYIISYKEFEDIRFDADLDGQIDFWYIKKGTTEVYTFFKEGKPERWQVRQGTKIIREASYILNGDRWQLEDVITRSALLMNKEDEGCEVNSIAKQLKAFTTNVTHESLREVVDEFLIHESCNKTLSRREKHALAISVAQSLSDTNTLKCLSSKEFEKAFTDGKLNLSAKLLAAKFELQKAQFGQQAKNYGPMITCQKADGQKKTLTTDESTKLIHLNVESATEKTTKANNKGSLVSPADLTHELLHRAGLKNEDNVTAVEKFCKSYPNPPKKIEVKGIESVWIGTIKDVQTGAEDAAANSTANVNDSTKAPKPQLAISDGNNKGLGSSPTAGSVKTGTEIAAKAATANVPVELTVAQTQIPDSRTLSESISNPAPVTEAGSQQALVRSASESSGMLRMANNLAGAMNTPALADTGSSSSDGGSNEVSRSVASKSSSPEIKGSSRNPASDLLKASTRTLANGDRVVEEITLDGTTAPAPAAAASASRSANVASVTSTSNSGASASRAPANEGGSSASTETGGGMASAGGGGFSGGSGSSAGSSLGFSGGAGGGTPTRGPAAASDANPKQYQGPIDGKDKAAKGGTEVGGTAAGSREEVITSISRSNYSQTKKKLTDPAFGKQLESQKITILDLYGNSYGATKGEVIFLDQGDRFVRQK